MNIKQNIFYIVRNYVKKYLTGNLGEIVEEEDRIVCFVSKNKVQRALGNPKTIPCFGIREEDKALAESYKLNKPIYYVIESIEFNKPINIFGYNCNVYINDCEFANGVYIRVDGKCMIEATDIKSYGELVISAKDLTLQDMYIDNNYWYTSPLNINISAQDKLNIDGCRIGRSNGRMNINLESDNELIIHSSNITGDTVNCKGKNICYSGRTNIDRKSKEKPMTRVLKK